jgi:hypothetical protein
VSRRAVRILALAAAALALAAATPRAQPGNPSPAPAPPAASSAAGKCGVCHPRERVQFESSRHAQEDIHCVSCHGGNDRELDLPAAHGAGFHGRPAHADIPKLCASCHADERVMRAYNLPVDQYALYQTSGHGRRLAAGDTRVAVCSDCHGAHDILPPSDPRSRVYSLNIPRTCGACHGDAKTAAGSRMKFNVFQDYLSSVHGRELVEHGNARAPTCVNCHGVHGAAPPAFGDVGKVCGQCHSEERRYFVAGPHREALDRAGLPECVSCHSNHAITAAAPQRLATQCTGCHDAGSREEALGKRLWTEIQTATAEIDKAAALTARAERVPLNTEDYRARLEEARTYLREALPAAHSAQEDLVTGFTGRARSVGQEVETEIYAKLGHVRTRKLLLIVFWFYLVITILVLRRFGRSERGV